eukprot:789220-Pleurochrysis_carterae.AAC.1
MFRRSPTLGSFGPTSSRRAAALRLGQRSASRVRLACDVFVAARLISCVRPSASVTTSPSEFSMLRALRIDVAILHSPARQP